MDKASVTPAGLLANLAKVAKNGLGLLLSRLELAALELSEVRHHLLKLLLLSALALLSICFAVGYGTALIVYLSWDSLGWKILGLLALLFAALAVALLYSAQRIVAGGGLTLPSTMQELQTDRETVASLF